MRHIPNFITSLNLASGFIAIILASRGDLTSASWLILAAMVFDFLDGYSARMLKAYSATGKELDSLADIVSFGVAPAFLMHTLLSSALGTGGGSDVQAGSRLMFLAFVVPAIMPVCAGIRLAVFNLDTTQTTSFKGLPTPANAIAVISVVIASSVSDSGLLQWFTGSPAALMIYTVILSLLMVSRLPLLSLKFRDLQYKGNEPRYILAAVVIVSIAVLGLRSAPLIIPFYIIISVLMRKSI